MTLYWASSKFYQHKYSVYLLLPSPLARHFIDSLVSLTRTLYNVGAFDFWKRLIVKFIFVISDLPRSRLRESHHGFTSFLHSSQGRLQVVGWTAQAEGKNYFKFKLRKYVKFLILFLGSFEHMQVRCHPMSKSMQRPNPSSHDVRSLGFHVHVASCRMRILQRRIFGPRTWGPPGILHSGADLLREQVRNKSSPWPHDNSPIQRLSQAHEALSALPTRVLSRHFVPPRELVPTNTHSVSSKMRGKSTSAWRAWCSLERWMQSFVGCMLV